MTSNVNNDRELAIRIAEEYFEKKISFKEFLISYPIDTEDEDIEELLDLIEHEPKVGFFFGVSKNEYEYYLKQIAILIDKMKEQ